MKFVTAYITCKDEKEASKLGKILVEQRLVGCVNIIQKIKSIYKWQGKITNSMEALLLAKAPEKNKKKIVDAIKKNHSYTVPCINFLSTEIGNNEFKKWLEAETGK